MLYIQGIAKNQLWMTFLSRLMSVSPVESLVLIAEVWQKISLAAQWNFAEDSSCRIFNLEHFFWEFCKLDIWQKSLVFFV